MPNLSLTDFYKIEQEKFRDKQLELDVCRSDLTAFIEKTFKTVNPGVPFLPNWHVQCIAYHLELCRNRDIKRMIINIPPRYLKSLSCTVAFPAWLLGHDPKTKIMAASYSKDLSIKHSVDCRFMIESEWYRECFPDTQIVNDNNQKSKYITTQRGQRFATSVGATATGEGGNFLIVDDPHSAEEAQSKVIREGQNNWFDQTFSTRLDNKERDVIIVIMQRLHQNDLTGHLLSNGDWYHLDIPAIFDKTRYYDLSAKVKHVTQPKELLHPERENEITLAKARRTMGEYAFAGQYLQRPAPAGGGIFKKKWFRLWPAKSPLPYFEYIVQSWDTAFTEDTSNDPTAFTVWGVFSQGAGKGKAAMLIDCWSEIMSYPELRKRARKEYEQRYGDSEENGKRADIVLIENKGSGIILIQDLIRAGVPVRKYNPGKVDKTQRAHSVTYLPENGLIFLPESDKFPGKTYAWAEEFVNQLIVFDKGDHDDYVDSAVQAWQLLRDYSFLTIDDDDDEYNEHERASNPYAQ